MEANQTEYFRLEQRSVINFLVAEKCKPCEIYWRINDLYGEESFSQKWFTKWQNIGLPLWEWVGKTVYGVEIDWLSGKKQVLGASRMKDLHADSLQWQQRDYHYWFSWKKGKSKQCLKLPTP